MESIISPEPAITLLSMQRVSLQNRPVEVPPEPGREAAVALASVHHPQHGDCLVLARTGDALPLGRADEEDTLHEGAVAALCAATGASSLRYRVREGVSIGHWTTESGTEVEGFSVRLPALFVQLARDVAYLPWRDLVAVGMHPEFHPVGPDTHRLGPDVVEFESPTLRVLDPGTGEEWLLTGLVGAMVSRWRHRTMPGG